MSRLTLLMLAGLLGGCAATPVAQSPAPAQRPRVAEAPVRCGEPVRMQPGHKAWTVEGFGGRDAQLMITERRGQTRCSEGPGATSTDAISAAQ